MATEDTEVEELGKAELPMCLVMKDEECELHQKRVPVRNVRLTTSPEQKLSLPLQCQSRRWSESLLLQNWGKYLITVFFPFVDLMVERGVLGCAMYLLASASKFEIVCH